MPYLLLLPPLPPPPTLPPGPPGDVPEALSWIRFRLADYLGAFRLPVLLFLCLCVRRACMPCFISYT